jgi:YHS domain-containing protein
MATDPVCKKEIDEKTSPGGKVNFWGNVFYFCTEECRRTFRLDPRKFAPETADGHGPDYDEHSFTWPARSK